jgi:chromate transporter
MRDKHFRELFEIFITFFKIGAFTIGGGLAMLPLIEREVVENKKWVEKEDIADIFAIVQSVPGVIAINSSIFIGYKKAKMRGAFAAALGVILPSFIIIILIAKVLFGIQDNIFIKKAFAGSKAGVTALLLTTVAKLSRSSIKNKKAVVLAILAFVAINLFSVHAFITIIAGGILELAIIFIRKVKSI